jgi:predicted metal-dependent peptidase
MQDVAKDDLGNAWEAINTQADIAERKAGTMSGNTVARIESRRERGIDYRSILERFATERANNYQVLWTHPNRRFIYSGLYIPGKKSDGYSSIALVVDTSGSMLTRELAYAGQLISELTESGMVDRLTVIYADTTVKRVDTYEPGDIVTFGRYGGGGTYFNPALAYIRDELPDVQGVIFITDGESADRPNDPGMPVLWLDTESGKYIKNRANFGEIIPFIVPATR